MFDFISKAIETGIMGFLLLLDGVVYWFIGILYDLYIAIAGMNLDILSEGVYTELVNRFLVVIGVAMLFYLAYALLKSLVNPDEAVKNTSKIITNLIISLVLLSVVPTIFTYAFRAQNIIISDRVIDKIVFGNEANIASIGKATAMTFFDAFITVDSDVEIVDYQNWNTLKICILDNSISGCHGNEDFKHIARLASAVADGDVEYIFLISTLCGAFLVYVIASFCLDLGVRIVKLAFYQIISPIPIMMRIIPEKKSVFDKWVRLTLITFFEVFVRIFIIYLISFLCANIFGQDILNMSNLNINDKEKIFGKIIIVMGIFAFAKQAPKLISEVIGIDSGNIKLGIMPKLAEGGGLLAAAAIGGGITAGVRNFTGGISKSSNRWKDFKNSKGTGFTNRAKAFGTAVGSSAWHGARSIPSGTAGTISGAARSGYEARNAKDFKGLKNAAGMGAKEAVTARIERENYKASHGGSIFGSAEGHIVDMGKKVGTWAGMTTPLEQLHVEHQHVQESADARKALADLLKKKMELDAAKRDASKEVVIAGLNNQAYRRLSTLQNDIESAKATGKTMDGKTVNSATLTEMQAAQKKLEEYLQSDILHGYKKDGSGVVDMTSYHGDLKEKLEAFRVSAYKNQNTISKNIDRSNSDVKDGFEKMSKAIQHNSDSIEEFISEGLANDLFDGSRFVINNANSNLGQEITRSIQKEKDQGKKS